MLVIDPTLFQGKGRETGDRVDQSVYCTQLFRTTTALVSSCLAVSWHCRNRCGREQEGIG